MLDLGSKIIQTLEKKVPFRGDNIIIENQPALKEPTMKTFRCYCIPIF